MLTWILRQLNRLPQPWRLIVAIAIILILIGIIVVGFGRIRSCGYDKARLQYEADSKAWQTERSVLLGRIAERDKQLEQLKAKEAALIAADQAGKKMDDALAQKIDEATKAAAAEATVTDQPTDCWIRADRTCAKLAGLKPPITIDCNAYKRKVCGQ